VHILRIYAELGAVDKLYPAWPQLQRVATCCQILLLATEQGQLHPAESAELVMLGIHTIRSHAFFWPDAETLAHDLSVGRAAMMRDCGVDIGKESAEGVADNPLGDSAGVQARTTWPDIELDWDSFFLQDTGQLFDSLGEPAGLELDEGQV
jgi:hypothetical protein